VEAAVADPGLDVGRLRLLREVELRGSIAAAARAVGLTSSAVSQQLAVLEREAGTALLDRSSRGVALTGAGELLAARAAQLTELLYAARADLDQLGGAIAGEVRLATVASAAATMVSSATQTLRAAYPGLTIRVHTAEPAASREQLLAGDVDIAVIDEYDYQPVALPDFLTTIELATEPLIVLAPLDFWSALESVPTPAGGLALTDLINCDWVMPPDDAACGFAVRAACRSAGFEPRVRWETDDMLLLTRAVAAGHGVAVLPRLSVDPGPRVERRALIEPSLTRRLVAVTRSASGRRPTVRAVLDALTAAATSAATGSDGDSDE
jgi:DNA-binding transcriptional LysR family regulator